MLSIKSRQKYLRNHKFYTGEIDGIEGSKTRAAYLAFQKKYMRPQDCDGVYGKNTDIALLNLARTTKRTPNFALEEFKCECGGKYCTGYPAYLDTDLLDNIQKLRDHYKSPMTLSSGLRCQKYNDSLVGSIPNSRHVKGQAVDFYGAMTNSQAKRKAVIKKWYTFKNSNYAYSDTPNMGSAIHVDVK